MRWSVRTTETRFPEGSDPSGPALHNEAGGSGNRSPDMHHDAIHKLLCSFLRVITDVLRGYLGRDLVRRLDFQTLEQVSAERVTRALRRRLNDSVWRARREDGTLVWV